MLLVEFLAMDSGLSPDDPPASWHADQFQRRYAALQARGEPYRIVVTPDHPTPVRTKTHSHGWVPFAMAGEGIAADAATTYDDPTADRSSLVFAEGWRLMGYFLQDKH